ncbi:hypothetical protein AVEN_246159-1 [Araneus ventricosus]|uniref:Uncharacterized protein n=1 Tax=Araneus ventricosus TaxID=182803 RepID=A0A4Y2N0Z7_ARAVE|nr:hypothetical protein AVEN_246159-1 [Araneus ventricosus]
MDRDICHYFERIRASYLLLICPHLYFLPQVLGYIIRFWWKFRARRKEAAEEETETVSVYVRDIFCLPPNFREERTEPAESAEVVVSEILTSCSPTL